MIRSKQEMHKVKERRGVELLLASRNRAASVGGYYITRQHHATPRVSLYLSSCNRLPAEILSITHSGLTTYRFVLLDLSRFWVLAPLSGCDETICVALEADCLIDRQGGS